jgi:hypothetical protein
MLEGHWEEPVEENVERPPDEAVEKAVTRIMQLFDPAPGPLLYQIQIAVRLEREFFHWVTFRALRELEARGDLQAEWMALGIEAGHKQVRVKFYRRRSHRNWRREAEAKLTLIRLYSLGGIGRGLGRHGEMMFDAGLGSVGFRILARDTREYGGRRWGVSEHNLDRIYERDGVEYGAEIKNTLSYIDRREFDMKLGMCRHLKVRPLFIMRGYRSPTSMKSGGAGALR